MRIAVFDGHGEMSRETAAIMLERLRNQPEGLFCVAAGHTQLETLRCLVKTAQTQGLDTSRARWVSLDEWVGFGEGEPGSCYEFVHRNLFEPLGIDRDRVFFFDGAATRLDGQCAAADAFIDAHGPIALAVLGVGLNGHLGFNEPGAQPGQRSHVTRLAETSVRVSEKYFGRKVNVERGITLGLRDLLAAERVIVQCTGGHKADIAARVMASEPCADIPASFVKRLQGCDLFLDRASHGEVPDGR